MGGSIFPECILPKKKNMSFSKLFQSIQDADNCAALTTQGTRLYLGTPGRCKDEPDRYTIAVSAAAAALAETISVFVEAPYPAGVTAPVVLLDQGRKLYFYEPGTPTVFVEAVLAESVDLAALTSGTAVAVSVNPLEDPITATMIATVWPVGLLTGTESLDWNLTSGSESTTRLASGLKGQEAITSLQYMMPASVIITPDDPILWKIVHTAATTSKYVYAFTTRPGGQYAWGTAQVRNYNRPNQKQTIQKASFELGMQDNWAMPTAAKYLSVAEQGYLSQMARLVGIDVPSFV